MVKNLVRGFVVQLWTKRFFLAPERARDSCTNGNQVAAIWKKNSLSVKFSKARSWPWTKLFECISHLFARVVNCESTLEYPFSYLADSTFYLFVILVGGNVQSSSKACLRIQSEDTAVSATLEISVCLSFSNGCCWWVSLIRLRWCVSVRHIPVRTKVVNFLCSLVMN